MVVESIAARAPLGEVEVAVFRYCGRRACPLSFHSTRRKRLAQAFGPGQGDPASLLGAHGHNIASRARRRKVERLHHNQERRFGHDAFGI